MAFFCKLLQECSSRLVPWTNFYILFQIQDLSCALQLFDFEVQIILFFFFFFKVEGIFYINELLEKLMFDELKNWAGTQGTVL